MLIGYKEVKKRSSCGKNALIKKKNWEAIMANMRTKCRKIVFPTLKKIIHIIKLIIYNELNIAI